jgi:hypothetical protein
MMPGMETRSRSWCTAGAVFALVGGLVAPVARAEEPRVVPRDEILEAMRHCQGYALTATANGARLQVEVLLQLIRQAEETDPERRPVYLGHREWYEAFLERTGLGPEEAPLYVRRPYEVGQDLVVDYRRERVIEEVRQGPEPQTVANVRIFWPDTPGAPKKFSYDDRLADPNLRVTQKRVITYRLVDYGDRIWYAEVQGLHGRPTTGALGLLFKLIGEARMVETRTALADDGLMVVYGHGKKLFVNRKGTLTVWPNGRTRMGVPEGRPDLLELAQRLQEPLEIRFRPFEVDGGA